MHVLDTVAIGKENLPARPFSNSPSRNVTRNRKNAFSTVRILGLPALVVCSWFAARLYVLPICYRVQKGQNCLDGIVWKLRRTANLYKSTCLSLCLKRSMENCAPTFFSSTFAASKFLLVRNRQKRQLQNLQLFFFFFWFLLSSKKAVFCCFQIVPCLRQQVLKFLGSVFVVFIFFLLQVPYIAKTALCFCNSHCSFRIHTLLGWACPTTASLSLHGYKGVFYKCFKLFHTAIILQQALFTAGKH